MQGKPPEGKMLRYWGKVALIAILACLSVTVAAWAQNGESRIDSRYSTASLSLASSTGGISWNIGIAKVSGTVTLNNDPDKDAVNLVFYPAREGSRLLNSSGGFKENSFADLARYTLMSFHSSRVTQNRDGKLTVSGELSVTHVTREANIVWSNAYSGADYGDPVPQTTTHQVTFIFAAPNQTTAVLQNHSPDERFALATVRLGNFPGLRSAWLDSVWPLVVEDEHCEMPWLRAGLSFKDYSGAICTGTPILPAPLSQSPQRFGIDYPGPNDETAPANDEATILIHLRPEGHR
jgi:polyisoprenoid-binding protein YceI